MTTLTDYHSAYYAYELTKRSPSSDISKLGASLFSASVDLNPHQLDAALFAFRSPLSRGAILADEVGLGKTIEAGLIVSQLWAERKRRILIIAPTILRKQWAQELAEKFHIPAFVMETREYNARTKANTELPFELRDQVLICSYHFTRTHEAEIAATNWDLVVIDEAHRLRNVYKPSNKISNAIKGAVRGRPLLLLTATPLQNSLLELYGLVSFLDEHLFGDIEAFRARYMRGPIEQRQLQELRHRLKPVCQRTLRRQVQEYVRFTNRIPITQDFTPTAEEQQLYDRISTYLQRDNLNALPTSQRKLMTMVLRKLLASSSFAIASTLAALAKRLADKRGDAAETLADFEHLDELKEEWSESPITQSDEVAAHEPGSPEDIGAEIAELQAYGKLAESITTNAKGQALLTALTRGFAKLGELGANQKAVIFTESRRTQSYLIELLNGNGYEGRVLTINGTNTDDRSGKIYREWVVRHAGQSVVSGNKIVDLRAALVEHFRDHADILIATEAAAEGVNLQFASLVVNYDLPWNPQRIEQRVGRCHRYGQKYDVVVINFLNRSNEADKRVFELLSEKFRLFDGVFGSSDEVLGALESGVDFERRIADIYQSCRSATEIDAAFDDLRRELEEEIQARMTDTRTALIENFDEEVHRRLKLNREQSEEFLDRIQRTFWNLTQHELADEAEFDVQSCRFLLHELGAEWPASPPGCYQFITPQHPINDCRPYRLGDALAERAIERAMSRDLPTTCIAFDYTNCGRTVGLIKDLIGESGWLQLSSLTVESLEPEDRLLFGVVTDSGRDLHPECGEKLMQIPGIVTAHAEIDKATKERLYKKTEHLLREATEEITTRNSKFFDEEIDKLERWADDLKHGLEVELKDIEVGIKQMRRDAKLASDLRAKLDAHRQVKDLESARAKKRRELFEAQDEIDSQKEALISSVELRLQQEVTLRELFSIRWIVT